MKTTLTIEESEHLIRLGINAKKAHEFVWNEPCNKFSKCFRLQDILSILPKEIDGNILVINATGFNTETEELEERWSAFYVDSKYNVAYGENAIFSAPELIDSLYQLLIWCLERGHLKTEKK